MEYYNAKSGVVRTKSKQKIKSVELFIQTNDVDYVIRMHHIGKASPYRWNKQDDSMRESLENKSHKPKTPHPNAHTERELKWINDYCGRNPNISICELCRKLREDKAYSRRPGALYRVFICPGCFYRGSSGARLRRFTV